MPDSVWGSRGKREKHWHLVVELLSFLADLFSEGVLVKGVWLYTTRSLNFVPSLSDLGRKRMWQVWFSILSEKRNCHLFWQDKWDICIYASWLAVCSVFLFIISISYTCESVEWFLLQAFFFYPLYIESLGNLGGLGHIKYWKFLKFCLLGKPSDILRDHLSGQRRDRLGTWIKPICTLISDRHSLKSTLAL